MRWENLARQAGCFESSNAACITIASTGLRGKELFLQQCRHVRQTPDRAIYVCGKIPMTAAQTALVAGLR